MSTQHERQEKLIEFSKKAPIVQTFGMVLSYNAEGQAVWDMPFNAVLTHWGNDTHGGVIATLLDNAGWFTVAPLFETWVATVEYQSRILEPVNRESLRAVGTIVRAGQRLVTATMEVRAATSNRLIAIGSGTFTVSSKPIFGV